MNEARNANELTAQLLVELPKAVDGLRVWRCSIGGAYPIAAIKAVEKLLYAGRFADACALLRRTTPIMMGGLVGLPDIDGILPDGRRLGVEVKFGSDTQSTAQKVCQKIYDDRGAVYILARHLAAAIDEVKRRAAR